MREDWEECLFGEILDIQGGSQPPKKNFIYEHKAGYIRLLQIQDFGAKPHPTYIPVETARKTCKKKDIFIARYGASLGRILRGMEGAYNVALAKVIRKINVYNDDFLFHLLQTQIFQQPIHMISRSAQNGFAKSDLNSIFIPIPSLVEQKAIITKIEELFSSLDSGIADLKKAQEQLKIYRQAVLKKAFEGELTRDWRRKQTNLPSADELLKQIKVERKRNYEEQLVDWKEAVKVWEKNGNVGKKPGKPSTYVDEPSVICDKTLSIPELWKEVTAEAIASPNKYALGIGPFGSNLKVSDYTEIGYPIVFVRHITKRDFSLNKKFTSEEKFNELLAHTVEPLDLLITKMGDPPGDCCVYPEKETPGVITSDCIKFKVWEKFVSREYIKYAILSIQTKIQLGLITQGVAQKKISLGRFKTLKFPFTDIKEQKQVVKEIESRLSVCDKVEESIKESLEKAEALRQSILKKAFEGKLLSEAEITKCKQAEDYEPASVLLDRIKKEKLNN